MPLLFLFISFFRFIVLSTSYFIPQYLITVQNYRAIEIGGVLKWIGALLLMLLLRDPLAHLKQTAARK